MSAQRLHMLHRIGIFLYDISPSVILVESQLFHNEFNISVIQKNALIRLLEDSILWKQTCPACLV